MERRVKMEKTTKERIKYAVLDLLKERTLDQITIKNIIEEAEVNRNTFYYYFDDIYALIDSMFEEGEEYLLGSSEDSKTYYEAYCNYYKKMLAYKEQMLNIYHSKARECLLENERKLAMKFIRRFVLQKIGSRNVSEEEVEFITYFYSATFYMNMLYWLDYGMRGSAVELITRTAESFEASIDDMIFDARVHTERNLQKKKHI